MGNSKARNEETQLGGVGAGRTLDEQIECILKSGDHCVTSVLRATLVPALGIADPKPVAENLVVFGCYTPFFYPFVLRDYMNLLDLLGVDYTYSVNSFCCGAPMILTTTGEKRTRAIRAGKESSKRNLDLARRKGASTIIYCCPGCSRFSRGYFANNVDRHRYIVDVIVERMQDRQLRVPPTKVGYFAGCQTKYTSIFPHAGLSSDRYRAFLGRIGGLSIIDLPTINCCTKAPERIVESAERYGLDTILCYCNGCFGKLGAIGKGRVKVQHLAGVLAQAMQG